MHGTPRVRVWGLLLCAVAWACTLAAQEAPAPPLAALPEGESGIASKYPGDAGIEKDRAVLFHDNFEDVGAADGLSKKWDYSVVHAEAMRITEEAANVHGGRKALEIQVPQQKEELSPGVGKGLKDEQDVLFLRYYSKFEKGFDQIGSSHNGATISAHYNQNGRATPGVAADGKNKFLCCFEDWRGEAKTTSPGDLNIYCYHPGQFDGYGDHFFPDGTVIPNSYARSGAATFGKQFVKRPNLIPELGRWYCFEFMVRANTVGKRDGRIACWVDGKLIADFPNMRFRDIESLKIDNFGVSLHIGSNTLRANKKWYDDVVAATSYIGPMAKEKKAQTPAGGK